MRPTDSTYLDWGHINKVKQGCQNQMYLSTKWQFLLFGIELKVSHQCPVQILTTWVSFWINKYQVKFLQMDKQKRKKKNAFCWCRLVEVPTTLAQSFFFVCQIQNNNLTKQQNDYTKFRSVVLSLKFNFTKLIKEIEW